MAKIISSTTSKNFYHLAKRNVICAKKLQKFYKKHPDASRTLGALPFDWLKNIHPDERANVTEAVSDCFVKFAKETKDYDEFVFPRRTKMSIIKTQSAFRPMYASLQEQLSAILKRDDISIDYEGSGIFKTCAKLNVGDYSYALSTFKDKGCGSQYRNYYIFCHGRGMEPQHVFVNQKRSPHGSFVRPFMSHVCLGEEFDGFILSKYVNMRCSQKIPRGVFSNSRNFFLDVDSHNRYNGVSFEAGGRFPNPAYIEDPKERFIWQQFAQIIDGNIADLAKKKLVTPLIVQDFLLEKSMANVDICSDAFRKNMRSELIPYYLRGEAETNPRFLGKERVFLLLLSKTKVDSPLYNFLLKKVGSKMTSGTARRFDFDNFGELVENMLKLANRKATKQIRAVKKIRTLKEELSAQGEFEKYKKHLISDVNRLFLNQDETVVISPKYYPELLDYELGLNKAEAVFREREF